MGGFGRIKRLVFWQNMPSHHQSGVLAALAGNHGYEVIWAVQEGLSGERAAMGWPEFADSAVTLVESPDAAQTEALLSGRFDETLHLAGGIFGVPLARTAFFNGMRKGCRFALMNEAPLPKGMEAAGGRSLANRILGGLQPAAQRVVRARYGRQVPFVLAIGAMAEQAYRGFGWGEKVFPYGYFPAGPGEGFRAIPAAEPFTILYLGQFSHRKGADVLVQALAKVSGQGWRAELYGAGELEGTCRAMAKQIESGDVEICDFLPWSEAMARLETASLVVVPSRHDGWGAVVGEALMRGVPVVATDQTGSQVLIRGRQPERGTVAQAGSILDLARVLDSWIQRGRLPREGREAIAGWAKCLEPPRAADYLDQIIRWSEGGARPTAPWESAPETSQPER